MFREPHSPRVVGMMLVLLTASSLLPSYGQDSATLTDSRLVERLDGRAAPFAGRDQDSSEGAIRKQGIDLGVIISGAYNDNIMLSSSAPVKDFVIRATPSLAYIRGHAEANEGGYLKVAYKPTAVVFADGGSPNRVDQDATWQIGLHGQKTSIAYEGRIQKLGDATPETGQQTDRLMLEHVVRTAWSASDKVALEVSAGQSSADYDLRGLVDSSGAYGEVGLRYTYSSKTRFGVTYRAGSFQVDSAGDQQIQRGTVRMEWKPREKITVDLEAGAEHRRFDAGSSTKPIINARVGWVPRPGTEISLSGYRRTEASSIFAGQNFDVSGASIGVSQKIAEKWTARLEGGLENASYSRVSGAGVANRRDRIVFIQPSVRYQMTDDSQVEWFYRYEKNQSSQQTFGYDNHLIGIQFGYQF
jgi:hypothetical protein